MLQHRMAPRDWNLSLPLKRLWSQDPGHKHPQLTGTKGARGKVWGL